MKTKWYLQTWLICILFALWCFIIPLIIGVILLILKYKEDNKNKIYVKDLNDELIRQQELLTPEMKDALKLQKLLDELHEKENEKNEHLSSLSREIDSLKDEISSKKSQIILLDEEISEQNHMEVLTKKVEELKNKISEKESQLVILDDELLVQSFGLYKPQFDFASSLDYKEELVKVRKIQKDLIKNKKAVSGNMDWQVNGSTAKGRKLVTDTQKLLLRAFNNECDDIVSKVKYTNFDASLNRIYKSADAISKLGTIMNISIQKSYLDAKAKELRLAFEYQQKKQEEKEAAKAAREEQREQAKVQKELEEQQKKIEKEQSHYNTAYNNLLKQIENNPDDVELLNKKKELEFKLSDIDKALADIDYRQANMKAGYVYIISNIGSFGENIYKIGMTRRLNPQERIDELGDASVPFKFDVHAMIFSDDAPALEASLHKAFENKKLNMVNQRREFFNVTLDEIKAVIKEHYDKTVEFIDVADAEQYRISQKLRNEVQNNI